MGRDQVAEAVVAGDADHAEADAFPAGAHRGAVLDGQGFELGQLALNVAGGEPRVQRAVGLPGDVIEMRNGALSVNGVAARGEEVPEPLKRELAVGGRLIIPVGGEDIQQLRCMTRTGAESWDSHDISPVRFVPLLRGTVAEVPGVGRVATTRPAGWSPPDGMWRSSNASRFSPPPGRSWESGRERGGR